VEVLETYMADCRRLVTEEICRLFDRRHEHRDVLYRLILDYPLREGKALRPTLALAMCRALGGDVDAVLPTAATLELYHNAFLVHDDVEDDSRLRRGAPTLHVEHGVPIAINVGDAMFCLSLKPLLDNVEVIGLGPALRILATVAHMTQESVEGQAVELDWIRHNRWDLGDADYVRMVEQKTGWYSFIVPMQVGAIAAGATEEQVHELVDFGRELSVAFQITDDLLNVRADPQEYGKEIGGDLWEGKRTLIVLHAVRTAGSVDRGRAVEILARARPPSESVERVQDLLHELVALGELTPAGRVALEGAVWGGEHEVKTLADVQWLFELLQRQGSIDYAAGIALRHATTAAAHLERLDWIAPSGHRGVIEALVAYVHERNR
jgi:geranylgeranyl diphosphate synthase type II